MALEGYTEKIIPGHIKVHPILQLAGLKEGDHVVSVRDVDCKWLGASEVLEKLKEQEEIEIQVISCQDTTASMVGSYICFHQI